MRKLLYSVLRIGAPMVVAALLLWFAFANVDFDAFLEKSKETNYWWVGASILLSLGGYIARAYRWNLLLKPLGFEVTTYKTTLSVLVGYLANLAFPRLGEVTRCAVLRRTDDVPLTTSLGSVITERLLDAITLLILIGLSFIFEYETISTFLKGIFQEYDIDFNQFIYLGLGLITTSIVIFSIFISSKGKFASRLKSWLIELYGGIKSIRKVNKIGAFMFSTILLWVIYYLMAYVIVFALEDTAFLSPGAGLLLLVTGGIALTLPVQGGIGAYHTMITALLMLYGIDKTTGLFMATLLHTSQILAVAVFGGIALLLSFLVKKK
ncbi:MAG: lysylphosphatidylglycerol synthase transmembrane domain-containing protein [Cyclobacteriaceae bacterium]